MLTFPRELKMFFWTLKEAHAFSHYYTVCIGVPVYPVKRTSHSPSHMSKLNDMPNHLLQTSLMCSGDLQGKQERSLVIKYISECVTCLFLFSSVSITYNIDWMKSFIPRSSQHLIPLQFSMKYACMQTGIRTIL